MEAEVVAATKLPEYPGGWSPGGNYILYGHNAEDTYSDLWYAR